MVREANMCNETPDIKLIVNHHVKRNRREHEADIVNLAHRGIEDY